MSRIAQMIDAPVQMIEQAWMLHLDILDQFEQQVLGCDSRRRACTAMSLVMIVSGEVLLQLPTDDLVAVDKAIGVGSPPAQL